MRQPEAGSGSPSTRTARGTLPGMRETPGAGSTRLRPKGLTEVPRALIVGFSMLVQSATVGFEASLVVWFGATPVIVGCLVFCVCLWVFSLVTWVTQIRREGGRR